VGQGWLESPTFVGQQRIRIPLGLQYELDYIELFPHKHEVIEAVPNVTCSSEANHRRVW